MPKCDFVPSHLRALCMHNLFKVGKIIKTAVISKKKYNRYSKPPNRSLKCAYVPAAYTPYPLLIRH